MAIDREVLNAASESTEVRTGCYQSSDRRTAVVVKVEKVGKCHYLVQEDSTVQLRQSFKEKFLRDYPIMLHNYPAKRGVRSFNKAIADGFKYTAEAGAIIRAILKNG